MKLLMARPTDFVDPEYDRRLAEFKARRAEMRKQMAEEKQGGTAKSNSGIGVGNNTTNNTSSFSRPAVNPGSNSRFFKSRTE